MPIKKCIAKFRAKTLSVYLCATLVDMSLKKNYFFFIQVMQRRRSPVINVEKSVRIITGKDMTNVAAFYSSSLLMDTN